MISRNKLKEYGFKEMGSFAVMKPMTLDIGRCRNLSIGDIGSPNEFMVINEVDNSENPKEVKDLVAVHNYDYDGYLTEEKLIHLLKGLNVIKP